MDESVIRDYEARLHAELEAIAAEGNSGAEDRATVELDQQAIGRLSRMDAMQRQAMAAARARRLDTRRSRVESALSRVRDGEFGWCSECGDEIPRRRLDLDPTITTCIGCAMGRA
jgi:DnaK suppressor protein